MVDFILHEYEAFYTSPHHSHSPGSAGRAFATHVIRLGTRVRRGGVATQLAGVRRSAPGEALSVIVGVVGQQTAILAAGNLVAVRDVIIVAEAVTLTHASGRAVN